MRFLRIFKKVHKIKSENSIILMIFKNQNVSYITLI